MQIPFRLRAEPVRCGNCTAWFRAPRMIEDGSYIEGELLAAPGEPLARPALRRAFPWRWLAAGALLAGATALAAQSAGAAGAAVLAAAGALCARR